MYQLNQSFSIPPPPSGTLWAFDTFAILGRREFEYQSLPGSGEFKPQPRFHVKSLGALHMTSYHGGHSVRGFSWKKLCLCGQLVTRKGLKQTFCAPYLKVFKF